MNLPVSFSTVWLRAFDGLGFPSGVPSVPYQGADDNVFVHAMHVT